MDGYGPAGAARVGFIGLGNVGAKLAGSLQRNGSEICVRDLNRAAMAPFLDAGACEASSGADLAERCDVVITCLPTPASVAAVLEAPDGVLAGFASARAAAERSAAPTDSHRKIWAEMSTTDHREVRRLGALVEAAGGDAMDCPVSGGCHRAATGNISIFAGGERHVFEALLPLLRAMGRRILHTGPLGSASILKVVTNYLATANLVSLCEALVTSQAAGMDLAVAYEAIRISSGNSFVHETESQVILNGSRDINFTMDLVCKDIGLFADVADEHGLVLDLAPVLMDVFADGVARYGDREWSSNIIRRLEDATGQSVTAPGFPAEIVDGEPEVSGAEVLVKRRR
ncbi:NAD(P)-dependent oxidoreductase [Candidatus Poriferisodalis sp.]|uniref:NAD(P)-dependent oxidoreductase n=1 Tax=Candidatus Poriferisodalis sp. TaxID=3101277 RepID=UPI003B014614